MTTVSLCYRPVDLHVHPPARERKQHLKNFEKESGVRERYDELPGGAREALIDGNFESARPVREHGGVARGDDPAEVVPVRTGSHPGVLRGASEALLGASDAAFTQESSSPQQQAVAPLPSDSTSAPSSSTAAAPPAQQVVQYTWWKHLHFRQIPKTEVLDRGLPNFQTITPTPDDPALPDFRFRDAEKGPRHCAWLCQQRWRSCARFVVELNEKRCVLLSAHRLSETERRGSSSRGGGSFFSSAARYYALYAKHSIADVALAAQTAGAQGLVVISPRPIASVAPPMEDREGEEPLHILTAVLSDKDISKINAKAGDAGKLPRSSSPAAGGQPTKSADKEQTKDLHKEDPDSDNKTVAIRLKSIERFAGREEAFFSFFGRYIMMAATWMLWSGVHFAVCSPTLNVLQLRTVPKVKVRGRGRRDIMTWSLSYVPRRGAGILRIEKVLQSVFRRGWDVGDDEIGPAILVNFGSLVDMEFLWREGVSTL